MYLRQLRKIVGRGMSHLSHPDLHMPRITKDKADVQSILKLLEDDWTNNFDPNESEFVSISTGTLAPPDVARGILDAHKIGMAAYGEFKRDRLEDEMPKAQFHDKITKKRLKTFSDIRKKTSTSASNSNIVILQADRNLFDHMVLVAESRHLRMSDVLSHPLGPLPWALANGDGTMKKTNKSALARELEKQVLPAETIPERSATIIDGMSLVQKMKGNDQTFAQLAESALTHILHEGVMSRCGLRYVSRRLDQTVGALQEYSSKTWGQVTGSSNGESFSAALPIRPTSRFLVAEWKTTNMKEKLNDKQLYVASEETCLHITNEQWAEIAGLSSNQEEALLLSCPSHNFLPLAGVCLCPLCHCGQVISRAGIV